MRYDKIDVERVARARPAPGPRGHRADLSLVPKFSVLGAWIGILALLISLKVVAGHGGYRSEPRLLDRRAQQDQPRKVAGYLVDPHRDLRFPRRSAGQHKS